jgi:hypothetical protein
MRLSLFDRHCADACAGGISAPLSAPASLPEPAEAPDPVPVSELPVPVSEVPVPEPPLPLVSPPVVGAAAGVETDTDGFTDELADDVLLSMVAAPAPLPVPLALADVPGPSLFAVASPSANESVAVLLSVVFTEPSEPASMCAEAEAEPSPTELADRSAWAADEADAVPSLPVLVLEPEVSTATVPVIVPPPVVETSVSPSAVDSAAADVSSELVVVAP